MKRKKKLVSVVALVLVAVLAFGLISTALAMAVNAASSSEIQQKIEDLQSEAGSISQQKSDLQSQIDATQGETDDMIYEKSVIDQKMSITQEEIANTTAQIEQYEQLIAEKEDELAQAKLNESELYEQYKDRLRALEENGNVTYWSILFKASSFSDLLDRIDTIQEIATADQEMMRTLEAASADIQTAQDELVANQEAMEEQKALLAEQEAELAQQSADAQVLIDRYASESAELQSVYDQYDSMEQDVLALIADAQNEYQAAVSAEEEARRAAEAEEARKQQEAENAKNNSNSNSNSNQNNSVSNSGSTGGSTDPSPSAGSGTYILPVNGAYISSPYGWRTHPIYGYQKFHYGIDYSVGAGTPIYAIASGTVTLATYDASAGNYVMVSHSGGIASAYMHMSSYIVSPGQYVSQGQVLGYVGSTGASTGPHLHLAMYCNGSFVNPANYVG